MSILAETMSRCLNKSGMNLAQLSKNCGIERSTLFQYFHGKRPLKNRDHLQQIMDCLYLTLSERAELWRAWQIDQVGQEVFERRKKVEWLIRSFPTLSDNPGTMLSLKADQMRSLPVPGQGAVRTRLELLQIMFSLMHKAHCEKSSVKILMQPTENSLLNSLFHPVTADFNVQITHIICMDNDSRKENYNNIAHIRDVMRYLLMFQSYRPLYYYGNESEHFGVANVLPCLFLTDDGALEISADEEYGIFHSDPAVISLFQGIFANIEKVCRPFGGVYVSLSGEVGWYTAYLKHADYKSSYEMCGGLCSVQFWTRELIETYINPRLPNVEAMIDQFTDYCRNLYENKRSGNTVVLMNPANVKDFLKTGCFREYPEMFFAGPLSPEDRRFIAEQILQAAEEGWYHVHFIDEQYFPLDPHWEILSQPGNVVIQHFYQDTFPTMLVEEHSVAEAVFDYLENLAVSEHAMSEEASMDQLREWMKEYLEAEE